MSVLFLVWSIFIPKLCLLANVFRSHQEGHASWSVCWPSACFDPLTSNMAMVSFPSISLHLIYIAGLWVCKTTYCRVIKYWHVDISLSLSWNIIQNFNEIIKYFSSINFVKEYELYLFQPRVKGSHLGLGLSLIFCRCFRTRSDFCSGVYSLAEAEDDGGQPLASTSLMSHQGTAGGGWQILSHG